MKRTTNKKILKVSLLPILGFACFAVIYPAVLTGSDNPTASHYLGMILFIFGIVGMILFWGWGVIPHVVSVIVRPIEIEAENGWLKPDGYGEKTLKSLSIFKLLNMHIEAD